MVFFLSCLWSAWLENDALAFVVLNRLLSQWGLDILLFLPVYVANDET